MPFVFACGECAVTGVHGANRLGGNSLLEGAYFGRIAGREAARVALKREFQPIDYAYVEKEMRKVELIIEGESLFNINAMRKNLGASLFKNAGVLRTEVSLVAALDYVHYLMKRNHGLHCVNKERHNNVELPSILEFLNAQLIAEAMVVSAMAREESRGVHFREDYPMRDDKHFNTASYVLQLGKDFLKVSFENAVPNNLWYNIKKLLHMA
jgi:succinate dehydrogenase / fumarate reductase flavoprotein subunit